VLKPFGLVYSEYRVLSVLRVRGREHHITPLELAGFVQLTAAGLTRALDRLEAAGQLQRKPNPEDRRSVLVGLTETGWDFAETVIRDLAEGYGVLLADLGSEDRSAITCEIRRLIDRLHSHLIAT
jgi:DNA-binding MarR family transcriptional regulator